MTDFMPVYITYEEAGYMLGRVSKRTIGRKVKAGELERRGRGSGARIVFESVLRHPDYIPPKDGGRN